MDAHESALTGVDMGASRAGPTGNPFRKPWLQRLVLDLNPLAACLCAGIVAGVAVGAGARGSMRVVALLNGSTSFTIAGSVGIVMLGAMFGAVASIVFAPLRRWGSRVSLVAGLLYGALLSALALTALLSSSDGELALTSPAVRAALFGPLPLLYGVALAWLAERFDRRFATHGPRLLHAGWLIAILAAFLFTFVGFLAVSSGAIRTPGVVQNWLGASHADFAAMVETHRLVGILTALTLCACFGLAIWRGSHIRPLMICALLALIGLGLLAAPGNPLVGMGKRIAVESLWLVRSLGLAALVAALVVAVAARLWWSVAGFAAAGSALLALWLAAATIPGWGFRNSSALGAALDTPLYWGVWLLLAFGLLLTTVRGRSQHKQA